MFGKKDTPSVATTGGTQSIDTVISANCVIEGNIRSTQSLKVDGRVDGNVQADGLIIIGADGQVNGDANSAQLLVLGQLTGNIKVGTLHLQSTARIHGNIEADVLQIDPGAQYQGSVTARGNAADSTSPTTPGSSSGGPGSTSGTDDAAGGNAGGKKGSK